MCWELPLSSSQHSKKNNMTEDNKDLQIKALVIELNNIKKDFAIKLEEIQALYLEIKQQKSVNEDHQKLNGQLRLELEELKLNKVQAVEDAKKREKDRKFQKSIENDRKRRARNKRRLEEAKLNKKNLFNKLGYIQRTKDENLEDLGAIDSQGLTIGGVEVPSFISGIGSAFTIDPSTKYFDEDSIREIGGVLSKSKT